MSDTLQRSGHCLCGAVRFTALLASAQITACHCKMCQRWTGGPLLAVDTSAEPVFEDHEHIRIHNTSSWAERGFCALCGSGLFYRLKDTGLYEIPVGLLDDTEGLQLTEEIYVDRKPAAYSFAEPTHKMTQAQVEEKYGQYDAGMP